MSRKRVTSRFVIPYTKYTAYVYVGAESLEMGLPSVSVPED